MSYQISRRDILKFTGGGILGLMFSPLPWKLLDDSSIWTQNWSLTPTLAHGPITTAFSHCTLCTAGCAVKADCVSGMPYFLKGVTGHPLTHGTLCPCGIASHHMAYHPLRILHPHMFAGKSDRSTMKPVSFNDALSALADKIQNANGSIAILDQQPNRIISEVYRTFLSNVKNGMYLTSPSREDATLTQLHEMMHQNSGSFGYDFENTKLIVSFGAPLFDGWGIPGRMAALQSHNKPKVIQIESRYSHTAMQADEWIALQPGTEKLLALSIAHSLLFQNLIPKRVASMVPDFAQFKSIVKNYSPEKTESITAVSPTMVKHIAQEIASVDSSIILSGADAGAGPFDNDTNRVIAALNILIGNIGKTGGIIERRETHENTSTPITDWTKIPDHSISVLIVDEADSGYAIPWKLIEQKLIPEDNTIVSLSPILNEISAHADYLIPAPGHFEMLRDVPNPESACVASFALSTPLLKKQESTIEPVQMISAISQQLHLSLDIPAYEELLRKKVDKIFHEKNGLLFSYSTQTSVPITEISSTDELWNQLLKGGIWIDEPMKQTVRHTFTLGISSIGTENLATTGLVILPYGWKGATTTSQISPILSKVFQETELREPNGVVRINPATAKEFGFLANEFATLSTKNGSVTVQLKTSNAVQPGVIEAAVAPSPNGVATPSQPAEKSILNLCEISDNGTWRITPAHLLKV